MKKLIVVLSLLFIPHLASAQDGAPLPIGGIILNGMNPFIGPNGVATGPILFPDGTASNPSIAFASQPALGEYKPATGVIGFTDTLGSIGGAWVANSGYSLTSGRAYNFTSSGSDPFTSIDTQISRVSAGVIGVTTAVRSGFISTGTGLAVANVGANSCGTTTATIAGGNNAFVITVGATSGTQCRVTFTTAAATEYDCAANDETTAIAMRVTPVDTTHTDFLGAFVAGDKVVAVCFPR